MSIKKNLFIIIFGVLIWLGLSYSVNAASLSISTNKSSASPGETINVTVTLSNGAGKITSGGQTVFLDNSSFSYTVTAIRLSVRNIKSSALKNTREKAKKLPGVKKPGS